MYEGSFSNREFHSFRLINRLIAMRVAMKDQGFWIPNRVETKGSVSFSQKSDKKYCGTGFAVDDDMVASLGMMVSDGQLMVKG